MIKRNEGGRMAVYNYEAAAYYNYIKKQEKKLDDLKFPLKTVVISIDDYSVGFCECQKDGTVKMVGQKNSSDKHSFTDELNKFIQIVAIDSNIDIFNRTKRLYYQSEMQKNVPIVGIADMDCEKVNEIFTNVYQPMEELLSSMEDLWKTSNFDQEEVEFILFGKGAIYYPVIYLTKSVYSFDPMLPDERFVNDTYTDSPEQIERIGQAEMTKKSYQNYEIYFEAVNHAKMTHQQLNVTFCLDENNIQYLEPIMISEGDKLVFYIQSKEVVFDIPFSIEKNQCDVIQIGAGVKENQPVIYLRKVGNPMEVFHLSLD